METLEFLQNVLKVLWGTYAYQGMFYMALIVILCMGKSTWKKMTYAVYSIIVVAGLLTPVAVMIGEKLWKTSIAYYCRMFSMVQIIVVIAYGIILLLCKIKGLVKPVAVCLVILMIMVGGNCVYGEPWIAKAENPEKIPEDVILISDALKGMEDVTIVAPNSLTSYIRQYDASVHMITGRDSSTQIAAQLDSDSPDVEYIMSYSGMQGVDYVIIHNKDSVRERFTTAGYELWYSTDNYLIYEVSGYERIKKEYNEREETVSITYYDEQGNIAINSKGYAIIKYEYDDKLRKEYEFYYGVDGEPVAVSGGYYGCKYVYDQYNRVFEYRCLDQSRNNMLITGGYSIYRRKYNENNLIIGEYYYDLQDAPVMTVNGYAGRIYEYNEKKQKIKVTYLDVDGKPTTIKKGYAMIGYQYDEQGNKIGETYYDINGIELEMK